MKRLWNEHKFMEHAERDAAGRLVAIGLVFEGDGILMGLLLWVGATWWLVPLLMIVSAIAGYAALSGIGLYLIFLGLGHGIVQALGYSTDYARYELMFLADGRYVQRAHWMFFKREKEVLFDHDMVVSIEQKDRDVLFYLNDGQIVIAGSDKAAHRLTVQLNRALEAMRRERPPRETGAAFGEFRARTRRKLEAVS